MRALKCGLGHKARRKVQAIEALCDDGTVGFVPTDGRIIWFRKARRS